ncbi:MAG: FMN-binding glutamate synthase family protein [Pseudomonadota bacterium]
MEITFWVLGLLAQLFVFCLGLGLLAVIAMFIVDVTQKSHAIRRNYPVVGRFRYLFEHLGEFFRQYFFAMDREEMPFNRAERNWVYRAAKGEPTTVGFGSTRDLRRAGAALFVNCPYPTLEEDAMPTSTLTIGPDCEHPYTAQSVFNISAMSYGALSRRAVLALAQGAARAGCWINSGEGGLSPYHLEGGADVVFQLGTAKFGARDAEGNLDEVALAELASHPQVKMIELKLSQGAKPGKGGMLPAAKVTEEIARIRLIQPGTAAISPNRHPDVNSPQELLDLVARIRGATGKPIGIKAVIGAYGWLDELFEEINRRGKASAPDFFTVDSADGGTGAAPQTLIDYVGLPLKESLPLVCDALHRHDLRDRVAVVASGKLTNPGEAGWALCAGADFVVSARGFMFALGCIQALQCNKNTCPTGITTHDPDLQKGLDIEDKAQRVRRYAETMRKELGTLAHSCGVAEPRLLRRMHCRIVQDDGSSIALDELHPVRNMPAGQSVA